MTNGCSGLIEKIGIHQKITGCALITFFKYVLELACQSYAFCNFFFLKENPHHITSRTEQAEL